MSVILSSAVYAYRSEAKLGCTDPKGVARRPQVRQFTATYPHAQAWQSSAGRSVGYRALAATYLVVAYGLIWVLRRLALKPLE
jgi:hypothetical protein